MFLYNLPSPAPSEKIAYQMAWALGRLQGSMPGYILEATKTICIKVDGTEVTINIPITDFARETLDLWDKSFGITPAVGCVFINRKTRQHIAYISWEEFLIHPYCRRIENGEFHIWARNPQEGYPVADVWKELLIRGGHA